MIINLGEMVLCLPQKKSNSLGPGGEGKPPGADLPVCRVQSVLFAIGTFGVGPYTNSLKHHLFTG